ETEGLIHLDEAPAFFVTPGTKQEEARIVFWLRPELPIKATEVVLTFSDKQGKLLDFEEHYLDLSLDQPTRVALELSSPELLNLANQVEVKVRVEALTTVSLGIWTVDGTANGLSFLPPDQPIVCPWPLELSLGGFVDTNCGRQQWRLVGQLALQGDLRDAQGELRFYLHDGDGKVVGHHVENVEPLLESCFGGWWTESHDEQRKATTLSIRLCLTATAEVPLGIWTVPKN
ncbi:MAG: hypothetical protein HN348_34235, partial [Proteobacteria bacterium]|nr:hypothetical protein [Pseudomonadota bacterium]